MINFFRSQRRKSMWINAKKYQTFIHSLILLQKIRMAQPNKYLTKAQLRAFWYKSLDSESPYLQMLGAYSVVAVASKGRTVELHGMIGSCFIQEEADYKFWICRKGGLQERYYHDVTSTMETEIILRWLHQHNSFTNSDPSQNIWHRIVLRDGVFFRKPDPVGMKFIHKIASYIARALELPDWELYRNTSFQRIGVERSLYANENSIVIPYN
jgi:hypothetical protein